MAGDDPNGRKPGEPGTPEETDMHFEDLEGWGAGTDETHVDVDDFTEETPPDGLPAREPIAATPSKPRRTTAPLPTMADPGAVIPSGFTPTPFDLSEPDLLTQPPHGRTLPLPGAAPRTVREATLAFEERPARRDSAPAIEERPGKRDSAPVIEERPGKRDSAPVIEERPARRDSSLANPAVVAAEPVAAPVDVPPRARRITSETGYDQPPPPIDPIPLDLPPPEGENTWLSSFQVFKAEGQKLARVGLWRKLAAMTGAALLRAPYARRMNRTGMLLDLARIYRDRLGDQTRAEQAFAILADEDPANAEALGYLVEVYEKRSEWGDIYDLYLKTMEATWDPNERLACARKSAEVAGEKLFDPSLAIKAWEQLWNLGDAVEEASRELARHYRLAGRWNEMARFLEQQAERQQGAAQLVTLRELAEVKLSGQRDPDGASKVLEQIVERSPKDPIATLQLARVYAQRKDWSALERLGQQAAAAKDVPAAAAVDLQHLVADSLWQAGRLEQAIAAYDRILSVDPADHDGTNRKREFLTRTSRFDELLALLEGKAESTEDDDARAEILAQAAQLAEEKLSDAARAAGLWERRVAIDSEHLPSHEALGRLYESLGDLKGIARSYEGQLALTREGRGRIRLLTMLGDHYASRMGDDERAEGCWKEILSIDPGDLGAREELIKLHRRRGDFESLNSALMRQIWLTTDLSRAEKLSRTAAENLDDNFQDPQRSVEAWRRVLDYAPLDQQALQSLERHYAALARRRESIGTLERQILAVESFDQKIARALTVARLWNEEGDAKAAAATFERILHWDPANAQALEGLVAIYRAAEQPGKAAGVLEHAAALTIDASQRIDLLRRVLELLPAEDHTARFFHLRRILQLTADKRKVVAELYQEAESAKLWPELAAVLTLLACLEASPEARVELLRELASLSEKRLDNKERALLALEGVLLSAEHAGAVLPDLTRLARQTKRFEDLLAILDRFTTGEFEIGKRKDVIRQRAALCEKEIKDPARAFHELRRLIELDPTDWAPLADLERLAGEHGLWRELDAVFAELGDRAGSVRERLDLLSRRERIAREKLDDRARAFDLLVRRYRLDMQDLDLLRGLTEDAESLGGWGWLLPILEATQLYVAGDAAARELSVTAELYESKLEDHEHAFTLYTYAFVTSPVGTQLQDKLEALTERTKRHEILADTFRMAAAVSTDRELTVELLRRIAAIYEGKLDASARAIDIHRRLLALKSDEIRSLEVMIEWHRGRSEWRDLRDRLRQWTGLAAEPSARVAKLLEIAQISEHHLADSENALSTFGEVLEIEPENATARQGLNGLVVSITEPSLRLRWLQMELKTAPPEQAGELRLEIAQIQVEDLGEVDHAIATLRELIAEQGPTGPGFAPLRNLLEKEKRWKDLVLLLQSQAESAADLILKETALDQAIAILHEQFPEGEEELREALYRAFLALAPANREIRMLLARLLRRAGRFQELAAHLADGVAHMAPADRRAALYELARLRGLNLEQAADSETTWRSLLEEFPDEEAAVMALARAAVLRGDLRAYLTCRQQQAKLLPPHEAALVLCHLAETCDESEGLAELMVPFYREARTLDSMNVPAMEALKGIGRRLKNLRPAAALLPFDGERDLAPSERAKRLKALGDGARSKDLSQAIEWYWRAVAVDPDTPAHWMALCEAMEQQPNPAGVFRARRAWLEAIERAEPIDASQLPLYAERMYQVALSARTAGKTAEYATRVQHAYETVPHHAPSALATAQAAIEAGDVPSAQKLLHTILSHHRSELSPEQQMMALHSRGLTLRELGRQEEAMDDIREALRIQPLHADALVVLGEMQAVSGRVAAAVEHQIRALMVVQDPKARARLCYRLGVLWEDGLGNLPEAGACYELALAEGMGERDLLHRALRHFQRTGRLDQSLEVVNGLLPTATDPEELATLWLVRGEIFAAREGYENEAIEAFDMALSYNPARQEARDGLVVVLERRGDYRQLLQVLEAACDVGAAQQQSNALLRMAEICRVRLDDPLRAEEYLRRAVMAMPTRDALAQLEQIYTVASGRLSERRDVLGHLVAFGPPYYERVLELSKLLLGEEKAWAWCLLSPLLGVSQVEADIKAVVQAMRKEYERPPTLVCGAGQYDLLRHPDANPQLTEVLAEMGELLRPLGISSLDQAGDGGAIAISEGTSLGKAFGLVAGACGMAGCGLYRTQDLPESVCVVNAEPHPMVVVRTEVMQQLVHAEVGFLFAYTLELAKPGHRVMAALSKDNREQLIAALWLTLGFIPSAGKIASKLADRIREAADEETRARWAESLAGLVGADPIEEGRRWWLAVQSTARRAGLVAGADLRQVFRVVARLEPEIPRPRVVARLDELDEYIGSAEVLRDLVAFAASPAFGRILVGATSAAE